MLGHQEQFGGWERRQASVLRCHLGGLAVAAALTVGLVGAPNAMGAQPQETSGLNYFHYYLKKREENGKILPLVITASSDLDTPDSPNSDHEENMVQVLLFPNMDERLNIVKGSIKIRTPDSKEAGNGFLNNYGTVLQLQSRDTPSTIEFKLKVREKFRKLYYCVKALGSIGGKFVDRQIICWPPEPEK